MSTEYFFRISVRQKKSIPLSSPVPSNMREILIRHAMVTGSRRVYPYEKITVHDILVVAEQAFLVQVPDFLLLSKRQMYTKEFVEILTEMRVPRFEQPPILDKLFLGVELADNPELPIACFIMDVTVFHCPHTLQLDCFEKVRTDTLDDIDRQKQCVICKESLDRFEGAEEGIDQGHRMIIRLSCSHLYHEDCIFQWLVMSPLCPVCRYSVPVVEEAMPVVERVMEEAMPVVERVMEEAAEPSKPSWRQLHWPMLLTASAGGILTALLVCRLLKQRQV
ncbi:hypothetical protein ABKV19_012077 [Rosa sericea]